MPSVITQETCPSIFQALPEAEGPDRRHPFLGSPLRPVGGPTASPRRQHPVHGGGSQARGGRRHHGECAHTEPRPHQRESSGDFASRVSRKAAPSSSVSSSMSISSREGNGRARRNSSSTGSSSRRARRRRRGRRRPTGPGRGRC